jgi:hypothetical protein
MAKDIIFDGATLEIIKWEKYNPRKDIKASNWFRLQNSLFEDPNFFDFSHSELLFFIYLLSMCSKKQCGAVRLNLRHAERIGRLDERDVNSAIAKLIELECVRVTLPPRNEDVTPTLRARHATDGRTDETNEIHVCTVAENSDEFSDASADGEPDSDTQEEKDASEEGIIPEFSGDSEIEAFLKPVSQSTQRRWIKLYTDPGWIRSEFLKAMNWIEVNPKRAPKKKLARFLGGWLSRGWEQHRKTIPCTVTVPSAKLKTVDDLQQEHANAS